MSYKPVSTTPNSTGQIPNQSPNQPNPMIHHTEININMTSGKPPATTTSKPQNPPQSASKVTQKTIKPRIKLFRKKSFTEREHNLFYFCCTIPKNFLSAVLGIVLSIASATFLAVPRCLNHTNILGLLCFPVTILYTCAIGVQAGVASVFSYTARKMKCFAALENVCACSLPVDRDYDYSGFEVCGAGNGECAEDGCGCEDCIGPRFMNAEPRCDGCKYEVNDQE